jgi:hypothetical protein
MVLLGDEAQVEDRFGPFGYSTNLEGLVEYCFGLFGDGLSVGAR